MKLPHRRVRTAVANGTRVLVGIDGRSLVARRYREVGIALAVDLGGDLSEAQQHLVRTAAGLVVLRERLDVLAVNGQRIDSAEYCRISNSLRRVLTTIGIERVARPVNGISPRLAAVIDGIAGNGRQ